MIVSWQWRTQRWCDRTTQQMIIWVRPAEIIQAMWDGEKVFRSKLNGVGERWHLPKQTLNLYPRNSCRRPKVGEVLGAIWLTKTSPQHWWQNERAHADWQTQHTTCFSIDSIQSPQVVCQSLWNRTARHPITNLRKTDGFLHFLQAGWPAHAAALTHNTAHEHRFWDIGPPRNIGLGLWTLLPFVAAWARKARHSWSRLLVLVVGNTEKITAPWVQDEFCRPAVWNLPFWGLFPRTICLSFFGATPGFSHVMSVRISVSRCYRNRQ